jgi:hypothetical protein
MGGYNAQYTRGFRDQNHERAEYIIKVVKRG